MEFFGDGAAAATTPLNSHATTIRPKFSLIDTPALADAGFRRIQ
jgi:hypothetical protein